MLAVAAVAATLALDLGTKSWAASDLRRGGARTVVKGHLTLRYQENAGAAFSLLAGAPGRSRRLALIVVSAAAVVAVAVVLARRIRAQASGLALPCGLALLLAGTLGNLIDRIARGWVVDFIEWRIFGRWQWPTFNFADIAISAGAGLIALHAILGAHKPPAQTASASGQ